LKHIKMKDLSHANSMPVLCPCDDDSADRSGSDSEPNNSQELNRTGSTICLADLDEDTETPMAPHVGHKKVLVTGGAGFIGNNVAEFLLGRGDDVVIVDEMNDYYDIRIKQANLDHLRELYPDESRLSIYHGDICDEEFMTSLFEKEGPKWICHMAARAGVRPSIQDPYVYIHSNIKGTTHLMELAHRFGVENFVFASSSSVYGGSKSSYFSEDENVDNPVSP
jgi:UDP-glucuronate 4-epimerase